MTDKMPERIWAGLDAYSVEHSPHGLWFSFSDDEDDEETEYIRADLHAAELAAKDAEIVKLRAVAAAGQTIMDALEIVGFMNRKGCIHGNSTNYPAHVWYCDECMIALEDALKALSNA